MPTSQITVFLVTIHKNSLGGSFLSAIETAATEKRIGRDISIWATVPNQKNQLQEIANEHNVRIEFISKTKFIMRLILHRIINQRSQVLHIHSGLPYVSKKIHIIRFLHGSLPIIYWLHGSNPQNTLISDRQRSTHLNAANKVNAIAVPSESERNNHISIGIDANSIFSIPNIITIKAPLKAKNKPKGQQVIFFCSRISPGKGCANLIESIPHLRPNSTQLVIAGDGPLLQECQSLALSLDLKVNFLGHVKDPIPLYQQASVFVAPSISESFGRTAFEAALSNTPMVLANIPPWNTIFEDGKHCSFVDPTSPIDIANKIQNLLDQPETALKYARNAKLIAIDFCSPKKVMSKLNTIYQHLRIDPSSLTKQRSHL